jgi:hypothetical protein
MNGIFTKVMHPFSKLIGYFDLARDFVGFVELGETNPTQGLLVLKNPLNDSVNDLESSTLKH